VAYFWITLQLEKDRETDTGQEGYLMVLIVTSIFIATAMFYIAKNQIEVGEQLCDERVHIHGEF
jgi:hypothetical protein